MRLFRILAIVLATWLAVAPFVAAQTNAGVTVMPVGGASVGSVGAAGATSVGPSVATDVSVKLILPTTVLSAGNAGPAVRTISMPAAGSQAIAVGGSTAEPLAQAALAGSSAHPITLTEQARVAAQAVSESRAGRAVAQTPDLRQSPHAVASIYENLGKLRAEATGAGEVGASAQKGPTILGLKKGIGHKIMEPITIEKKDGTVHPLSYDPKAPTLGPIRAAWNAIKSVPEKIRLVRRYMARVDDLVYNGITDDNLWWSINRLDTVSIQEGILRPSNGLMVNKWSMGSSLKEARPADFKDSSLSMESRIKLFKRAMDLEEPTLQYQYAFAQNLHNLLHTMSHFLGWTFQERLLLAALKDKTAPRSIWATEEVRHGPVLETVYNMTRDEDRPPLWQQGEAPRLPQLTSKPYLALSGMANRSLAELAAASAYLTLKANSTAGSATDQALDGIYRDEVYHYVIMSLVNKFAMGQGSRWTRLFRIFRHDLDYRPPPPNDTVIHKRSFSSPLMMFEVAYALLTIDKRIDKFLKAMHPETAKDLIGPAYLTEKALKAAVEAGKIIPTRYFSMEQNPDLTHDEVQTLASRFPEWFDADKRQVKASDIRAVLDTYRGKLLTNPAYWMRRKAFKKAAGVAAPGHTVIERALSEDEGTTLRLDFETPGQEPLVTVVDYAGAGTSLYTARLKDLSLLQVGVLMDADKWAGLAQRLEEKKQDLTHEQLLSRLNNTRPYQEKPIPLVKD